MKLKVDLQNDGISIHEYTFTYKDGKRYTARRASREEKQAASKKGASSETGCTCGEEWCDGEWLWRCMYAGAGECDWFITTIVCEITGEGRPR
jgi:hypothetical protein